MHRDGDDVGADGFGDRQRAGVALRMRGVDRLQVAGNRIVDSDGDSVAIEVRYEAVAVGNAQHVLVPGVTGSGTGGRCRDLIQVGERGGVEGCDALAARYPVRQVLQLDAAERTLDLRKAEVTAEEVMAILVLPTVVDRLGHPGRQILSVGEDGSPISSYSHVLRREEGERRQIPDAADGPSIQGGSVCLRAVLDNRDSVLLADLEHAG